MSPSRSFDSLRIVPAVWLPATLPAAARVGRPRFADSSAGSGGESRGRGVLSRPAHPAHGSAYLCLKSAPKATNDANRANGGKVTFFGKQGSTSLLDLHPRDGVSSVSSRFS